MFTVNIEGAKVIAHAEDRVALIELNNGEYYIAFHTYSNGLTELYPSVDEYCIELEEVLTDLGAEVDVIDLLDTLRKGEVTPMLECSSYRSQAEIAMITVCTLMDIEPLWVKEPVEDFKIDLSDFQGDTCAIDEYIALVRETVEPYYNLNDACHHIEHADEVCANALDIARRPSLDINVDEFMIVAAAYAHDVQVHVDRENHHLLAKEWVLQHADSEIFDRFSYEEVVAIAEAVYAHRSSFKGVRNGQFNELIAVADMGPVDLVSVVKRVMKTDTIDDGYRHIKDKFGTDGYRQYPELYHRAYGNILDGFNKQVDELTYSKMKSMVEA